MLTLSNTLQIYKKEFIAPNIVMNNITIRHSKWSEQKSANCTIEKAPLAEGSGAGQNMARHPTEDQHLQRPFL